MVSLAVKLPQWFLNAQLAYRKPVKLFQIADTDMNPTELRAALRYVTSKLLENPTAKIEAKHVEGGEST
jgi:hypothetical protein